MLISDFIKERMIFIQLTWEIGEDRCDYRGHPLDFVFESITNNIIEHSLYFLMK